MKRSMKMGGDGICHSETVEYKFLGAKTPLGLVRVSELLTKKFEISKSCLTSQKLTQVMTSYD